MLEPDQQFQLQPGSYSQINLKSRAKAFFSPGTYVIGSLSLEPDAEAPCALRAESLTRMDAACRGMGAARRVLQPQPIGAGDGDGIMGADTDMPE